MARLSDGVNVSLGVLLWAYDGRILLGQRISDAHGKGEFSLPGGKLTAYESPQEGASCKVWEETGLWVSPGLLQSLPIWTYDRHEDHEVHFVTLYFDYHIPMGQEREIENLEPDKCGGWSFYWPDKLPAPLFSGVESAIRIGQA